MFVDECHVTRLNQGLFSTTMEAEKRDPGNEVEVKLSTVGGFFWTHFLISATFGKLYAPSAHHSGSFLVDTHYLKWNFICSSGYTRSGVTALSRGHLFYELRLLVEFSRNLIRINPCLLSWQHISLQQS